MRRQHVAIGESLWKNRFKHRAANAATYGKDYNDLLQIHIGNRIQCCVVVEMQYIQKDVRQMDQNLIYSDALY